MYTFFYIMYKELSSWYIFEELPIFCSNNLTLFSRLDILLLISNIGLFWFIFICGNKMCIRDSSKAYEYYLLNKPKGVVTTTNDEKGRNTVIDLIETNTDVYKRQLIH